MRGPVAIITVCAKGNEMISSRTISINGCLSTASDITDENSSRSTARAVPAATSELSAALITSDPAISSSFFSSPGPVDISFDRREFEQTSSASPDVLCASVILSGLISYKRTFTPNLAACHAASQPARPPPIISISSFMMSY